MRKFTVTHNDKTTVELEAEHFYVREGFVTLTSNNKGSDVNVASFNASDIRSIIAESANAKTTPRKIGGPKVSVT